MKAVLMPVYSEELTLWTAFEEAKKRSERTGLLADAIEAKRCLKAFYSYQCPIIQKNLGAI